MADTTDGYRAIAKTLSKQRHSSELGLKSDESLWDIIGIDD
jgi:hypothetical protein